jgi:hypothetical protein
MADMRIKFSADTSQAEAAMGKIESRVSGMGSKLAGALSVTAIAMFARSLISSGDAIADSADAVNISARAFQTFGVLAKDAGGNAEQMQGVLQKIGNAQMEALADSTGTAAKQFAQMGISLEALRGMNTEQVIEAFSRAVANGSDNANVMSAATDIMGVRAAKLIPVFQQVGADGIEPLAQNFQELGRIMSDETIAKLDATQLKLDTFWDGLKNKASQAIVFIIEGVERLAGTLGRLSAGESVLDAWDNSGADIQRENQKLLDDAAKKRTTSVGTVVDQAAIRAQQAAEEKAARDTIKAKDDAERESTRRKGIFDSAQFSNEQKKLENEGRKVEARARDIIRQLESGGKRATEGERESAMALAREQIGLEGRTEKARIPDLQAPAINDLQRIGAIMGGQTNQQRLADLQQRQLGLAEQQLAELRKIAADPVEVFA